MKQYKIELLQNFNHLKSRKKRPIFFLKNCLKKIKTFKELKAFIKCQYQIN